MTNKINRIIIVIVVMLLFTALVYQGTAQTKQVSKSLIEKFPKGDWSIAFHSYQGEDYLNAPVTVFSVTSRRARVEQFSIRNISNKSVTAVKMKWLLYENEDRKNILQQGETAMLNFEQEFIAGDTGFIKYKVISLNDLFKPFLIKKQLNKNFDVDLLVTEVQYADGSVWRWEDGKSPDLNLDLKSNMAAFGDCPKQKCVSRPSTVVNGVTYSCGASEANEGCLVQSGFDSCTNSSCARDGGGSGGGGHEIILD